MHRTEVHDTLRQVELYERLVFDLAVTDTEYRSDHEIDGVFKAAFEPTKAAVTNRETSPLNPLLRLANAVTSNDSLPISGYPGTTVHVGIGETTPPKENEFDERMIDPEVTGIPEDDTLTLESDWELAKLRDALAEGEDKVKRTEYDVSGYPVDQLPFIVRANLRDAKELGRKEGLDEEFLRREFEGQHVLEIELEYRGAPFGRNEPLDVRGFRVETSRTFPNVKPYPQEGATMNPERKRIEWYETRLRPGDTERYALRGPVEELTDLGDVTAELRGRITGTTLSGLWIAGVFDESGRRFDSSVDLAHEVQVKSTIAINPDALSGDVQRRTKASIQVSGIPKAVYEKVVDICTREAIHITEREHLKEAEPDPLREGVYVIDEDNKGSLKVKREYDGRGIVYGEIEITGEWTPQSQESQVSTTNTDESKIIKVDEGLETRGRSQVDITVRSVSTELNDEFVSSVESGLLGK